MKSLLTFTTGAVLCMSALLPRESTLVPQPCLYYAETPDGTEAYYSLEDAQQALADQGVDYRNVPSGYDITSKQGC